jgi:hypothetical protein
MLLSTGEAVAYAHQGCEEAGLCIKGDQQHRYTQTCTHSSRHQCISSTAAAQASSHPRAAVIR